MVRLTAKERILIHLLDFTKYADSVEVPAGMTQEGIANAAWILVPHVTQYVRPLIRDGLVRERNAHIEGGRRRRKVYDLTESGRATAIRMRNSVKAEIVRVRDARGIREETVANVLTGSGHAAPLLEILRRAVQSGIVDLDSLVARPAPVGLQVLSSAPQVEWFIGREGELGALTKPDGPRIFVVRGVAGRGKTTLAARACEILRTQRNLFWHRVRPWDTTKSMLAALGDFLAPLGKPGLRSILTRRTVPFYDRRDVVLGGVVKEILLGGLDPSEFASVLSGQPGSETLADACRAVGGHPLFLKLVRAGPNPPRPAEIRRDLDRFVEETVYRDLGESERQIMKVACLYRVPMPRDAFLPGPGISHDAFLSLVDRALITPIGDREFGVHDTIQAFFESVLSPSEKSHLAIFATRCLRAHAAKALETGDTLSCIDCLSNVLRFAPVSDRAGIQEELADAHERVGDFPAARGAYQEALKATNSPEATSRIHRKLASALLVRGDMKSASSQIDAALRAVGGLTDSEKGRIDLLRSELASSR